MKLVKKPMPYPKWKKKEKKKPFWQRFLLAILGAFSALFAGGGVKKASGQFGMSISNQVRVQGSEQAATGESNVSASSDFNLQTEVNRQLLIEKAGAEATSVGGVIPIVSSGISVGAVTNTPVAASTYTVKSGDTLWKIAETYYGQGERWTDIWKANRANISEPNLIYPGQNLSIPVSETGARTLLNQTATTGVISKEAQTLKNGIQPQAEALNQSLGQLVASVNQYVINTQNDNTAGANAEASKQVAAYAGEASKFTTDIAAASSQADVIDAVINLLDVARIATATANRITPVNYSVTPVVVAAMQTSVLGQAAGEQVGTVNANTTAISDAVARIKTVATAIIDSAVNNNVALPTLVTAEQSAELAAVSANRAEEAVVVHQPGQALMQTIIATNAAIAANVTELGSQVAASASASAARAITALQSVNPAEMQQALLDYQISGGGGESGPSGVGSSPDVGTGPGTTYSGGLAIGNTGITLGGNLGAAGQSQGPVSSAIQGATGIGPLGQAVVGVVLGAIPGIGIAFTGVQVVGTVADNIANTITNNNIATIANEIQNTIARNVEDISQTTPNPAYSGISNPLGNLANIGVTGSGLQGANAVASAVLGSGIGIGGAGSIGDSGTIASVANTLGITQTDVINALEVNQDITPAQAARLRAQVTDSPKLNVSDEDVDVTPVDISVVAQNIPDINDLEVADPQNDPNTPAPTPDPTQTDPSPAPTPDPSQTDPGPAPDSGGGGGTSGGTSGEGGTGSGTGTGAGDASAGGEGSTSGDAS